MKKSLLNKIMNMDNQKFKKGISAGLLALMLAGTASNLTACNVNPFSSEEESSTYSETSLRFGEGRVFSNVKERTFNGRPIESVTQSYLESLNFDEKNSLENLPLPFEFLIEEGLCSEIAENEYDLYGGYRARDDMGRIAGGDVNTVILKNENDSNKIYMFIQYTYGWNQYYQEMQTNRNAGWVASYLLEYTLSDQDYYDLQVLLKANDFRTRFFVQEMDKIYTPNVLSKSVYDFYSLWQLNPFEGLAGIDRHDVLSWNRLGSLNLKYIESVDYDNNLINVNYYDENGKDGPGIYQYTINPVENEKWWNNIIEFLAEVGETPELEFSSYPTIVGEACSFYSYTGLTFSPTDEMKDSAKKVYDIDSVKGTFYYNVGDIEASEQSLKTEGLVQ